MIISDLNHVEVVSEETETSIEGGYHNYFFGTSNYASGGANAIAFGQFSSASTNTSTATGSYFASSSSGSNSSSSSYGYGYYPYYYGY